MRVQSSSPSPKCKELVLAPVKKDQSLTPCIIGKAKEVALNSEGNFQEKGQLSPPPSS